MLTHKNEINWEDETLPKETDFLFERIPFMWIKKPIINEIIW